MANLYPSDPSYAGPPTTNPDLTQAERLARIEEHLGLTVAAPTLPAPPEDAYPVGAAEANAAAAASLAPPVEEPTPEAAP